MTPSDDIPPEVRALVRETFEHAGNAATDGRPWNINTAMRFAELCVVADRAARTPDAAVLREAAQDVVDAYDACSGAEPSLSVLGRFIDVDLRAALASPEPITKTAIAEHGEPDAGVADMVLVPRSAVGWLFGETADADGKWFGEVENTVRPLQSLQGGRPKYWWRSHFRSLIAAAPSQEQPNGK